ncbi:MAG: radical SAM family heme chaperone HemW [Clostridia bacterium]|nr:radical SAM family heme chaperone HemW [Clostridia bacterium]
MLGLYVHVPFCLSKCPYCDFYSIPLPDTAVLDAYTDEVCRRLQAVDTPADTLYFGGGTPSLLGGERLARIIGEARRRGLRDDAEVTLEANPADRLYDTLAAFAGAGGNRLSLGMQAVTPHGLAALGRRHTVDDLEAAVADAAKAGLSNLSLDIMLATPSQTEDDVKAAVKRCDELGASHVSAYLLKTEPGTPFFERRDTLDLPDEDQTAALYLLAGEQLEAHGFAQYEISNFAKNGAESRHNRKYWDGQPYLGIGPAAHSFINGKRWYFERSLEAFLQGAAPKEEDPDAAITDNSEEEYAMLRLRLTEGLCTDGFEERFGHPLPTAWIKAATRLPSHLVTASDDRIALTREGFLLSNALTARILWSD